MGPYAQTEGVPGSRSAAFSVVSPDAVSYRGGIPPG
jgi:hypothetical protein